MKKLLTLLGLIPTLLFGQTPTERMVLSAGTPITRLPAASTATVSTTDTTIVFRNGVWVKTTAGAIGGVGAGVTTATPPLVITGNNISITANSFWETDGNVGTVAVTNFVGTTDNVALSFKTNNTEKVQITTAGDLRVGNQSLSTLDAQRWITVGGATVSGNILLLKQNAGIASNLGSISFGNQNTTNNATAIARIEGVGGSNNLNAGRLQFLTRSVASISNTIRMVIDTNGFVGIGTIAPTKLLQLGTSGTILGTFGMAGNTSGLVTIQPLAAAGTYTLTLPPDDGTANQVLTTDGNGIMTWTTSSGGTVTSVTGSGNIASSGGATPNITFTGILPIANGGTNIGTIGAAGSSIYSNGTQHASTAVGVSGQVLTSAGAGTPAWSAIPTQTVTITAGTGISVTGSINTFTITNTSPSSLGWLLAGNGGTTPGTDFMGTTDSKDIVFKRNSSEAMRIYSPDNFLGIGTNAPAARLHVVGSASTSATWTAQFHNSSGTSNSLMIRDDGNIGIGTSAPTSDVTVVSAAKTTGTVIDVSASALTTGRLINFSTTGNSWTGNGLTTGLENLSSTSTGGTSFNSSIMLKISRSGANANSVHNAYGVYSTVTNTGTTSTDIAGYFSASGGTANYAIVVPNAGGNIGFGNSSPTDLLSLGAGTASIAPLQFTSGTLTTGGNIRVGQMQFLTDDWYVTTSASAVQKIGRVLTGSATLDFANLASIGCEDLTITVTGAADGDDVVVSPPNGSVVANTNYSAWVSSANTVSVRFCALVSGNPASGTFKVTVIKN